jgi:hypothetical protein
MDYRKKKNQHWNSESIYTKWRLPCPTKGGSYSGYACKCHDWTLNFDENDTTINGYA